MNLKKTVCALVILGMAALRTGPARAETIEIVTYFPSGTGAGAGEEDAQFSSVRVGPAYASLPFLGDGIALVFDRVGIGIPAQGDQSIVPAGALEVRGAPDTADRAVFVPGADDITTPTQPSLVVKIGTPATGAFVPRNSLYVTSNQNGWAQVAGMSNPNTGNNALTVFQVGQDTALNGRNGMLVYGSPGLPANFQGYHNPNQFDVVASAGAVSGLALVTVAAAPIRFVTNGGAAGNNERMRIFAGSFVGIGTNNPGMPLQVGASNLFAGARDPFVNGNFGGFLEIGGNNAMRNPVLNGTPYVDFHFGRVVGGAPVAQDFNARLINAADGRLDVQTSVGGAAAQTRLSIGPNLGVGTAAPQTTSPQNNVNTGNLDANDVFIRSRGLWLTQIVNRFLGAATVANFANFVNFNQFETVIGSIDVTATGRPLLIAVSYVVRNDNNGPRGYASRIRMDGTGVNGTVVMRHGGGVQPRMGPGQPFFDAGSLICTHTPPPGQHRYYFNLWNGSNNQILRGQVTQISVTEVAA